MGTLLEQRAVVYIDQRIKISLVQLAELQTS